MRKIFLLCVTAAILLFNIRGYGQSAGDYQSVASGNWNATATWNYYNGTAWGAAPTAPTGASGTITIQAGHNVTANIAVTLAAGATIIDNGILTNQPPAGTYFTMNGTFVETATGSIAGTNGFWKIYGTIEHRKNGGTLDFLGLNIVAIWGPGATYLVTGVTTTPPSLPGYWNFGQGTNLVWNCPGQTNDINVGIYNPTYSWQYFGSFTLLNSNGWNVTLFTGTNYNVYGDLVVDGASSKLTLFTSAGSVPFKNCTITNNGQLYIAPSPGTSTSYSLLTLNGNLTVNTGGNIGTYSGAFTGIGFNKIVMQGSAAQTVDFTGAGTVTSPTAESGILNLNVQEYTGGSVVLNSPLTVNNFSITGAGKLTTTSTNLLTVLSTGSVAGGSTTAFVDGPLAVQVAATGPTAITLPIGKGTVGRAAQLTVTHDAATMTTYTAEMFNAAPPLNTLPATLGSVASSRYYNISKSAGANVTAAAIQLSYGADDSVKIITNERIAKNDGLGNWVDLGGSGTAPTTGTITSANNFTDFTAPVFVLANAPVPSISGNAGIGGVTLSWTDGSAQTTTADVTGNYVAMVSQGWSGTITPSLTGYSFTPISKTYSNVTTNITGENYTAAPIRYTISGNAGVAGAALNWTDGGLPQSTVSDPTGAYSFTVSYNWSGTVTPT